jgi:hypothetical protein
MIKRVVVTAVALLGPLGALGGLGGLGATAYADATDNQFLSSLKAEGITDHVSPAHAIEAGHMVCQKLDEGMSPTEVADDVVESSSMPAYHAGYFVSSAIKAYCPQYTPGAPKPGNG